MTVIQSYNSKNTPSGKLHAVKITEAVLLYVFTIVFPTSPFSLKNHQRGAAVAAVNLIYVL